MNGELLPAPITSVDNPQFKALKKLVGSGRERRKSGQTLLDGIHLIDAWLAAGHNVQKNVLSAASAGRPEVLRWLVAHPAIKVVVLADALFDALIEDEPDGLPSGFLALVDAPAIAKTPRLDVDTVVLDGVQDPGNVGTLLRTAAAAGFLQAVLSSACAQAWSPKVLRAGMGAHFALQVFEHVDLPAYLQEYTGSVAVTDLAGDVSLYDANLRSPVCWVFGSEGEGVSAAVAARATLRVKVPMPGKVESLNVAAAAAICLFESVRRRGD